MQFACENCGTRYAVPDEKVAGKRVRTQCRKCGAEILIEGPPVDSVRPAPRSERLRASAVLPALGADRAPTSRATPVARSDHGWTVAVHDADQRTMMTSDIVDAFAAGVINGGVLVWKDGMEAWKPVFEVPAIAMALAARGFAPDGAAEAEREGAPSSERKSDGDRAPTTARGGSAVDANDLRRTNPARPSNVRAAGARASEPPPKPRSTRRPPVPRSLGAPRNDAASDGNGAPRAAASAGQPRSRLDEGPTAPFDAAAFQSHNDRSLTPGPVPHEEWQDDDEATHILADRAPETDAPAVEGPGPVTVRGGADAAATPMALPSERTAANEFEFDNETTAVIGADRARQLLQGEGFPAAPKKPASSLDFIFDDEATEVIDAERATALLHSDPEAAAPPPPETPRAGALEGLPPPPPPPKLRPYPPLVPAAGSPPSAPPTSGDVPPPPPKLSPYPQQLPVPIGALPVEPSVVVAQMRRIRAIPEEMTRTLPPKEQQQRRALGGISHEKTRLVRVVQRKKTGGASFWLMLLLALAAAAVGGFLISQMVQRHGASGQEAK